MSKQVLMQDGLTWKRTNYGGWVTYGWPMGASGEATITAEIATDHYLVVCAKGRPGTLEGQPYASAWSARRGAARWLRALGVI